MGVNMGYLFFIAIVGLIIYVIYLHIQRDIRKRECEYLNHAMANSLSSDISEERRRAIEERDQIKRDLNKMETSCLSAIRNQDAHHRLQRYGLHVMANSLASELEVERDRAEKMKKALKKALITGLPPHDVSGQRMWQEAQEALEEDE